MMKPTSLSLGDKHKSVGGFPMQTILVDCDRDKPLGSLFIDVVDVGEVVRRYNTQPLLLRALEQIHRINGSTGGPESLVNEFKTIARIAIAEHNDIICNTAFIPVERGAQ